MFQLTITKLYYKSVKLVKVKCKKKTNLHQLHALYKSQQFPSLHTIYIPFYIKPACLEVIPFYAKNSKNILKSKYIFTTNEYTYFETANRQ